MRVLIYSICFILLLSWPALSNLAESFHIQSKFNNGNSIIDIVRHNGGVYAVGNNGIYYSLDDGANWHLSGLDNGMISDKLSAINSCGGDIWIATSHNNVDGFISDGLSVSFDNGICWQWINFGPSGVDIPFLYNSGRTIYDIASFCDGPSNEEWLFFTAFAGGFIISNDGGNSFRRCYPSLADSIDFAHWNKEDYNLSNRNLYFSCAVDLSREDTLTVWAGTADGVFEFIFADNDNYSDSVNHYNNEEDGLTGNFIQSLAVQNIGENISRVWVSNNIVGGFEQRGLSVGTLLPVTANGQPVDPNSPNIESYQRFWKTVLPEIFAWNFAFNGDSVFVAANIGLVYNIGFNYEDNEIVWDTLIIGPNIDVYSIEVINPYIWIGTSDCIYRLNIDDFSQQEKFCMDITDIEDPFNQNKLPNQFSLFQNHPNPFNPTTKIEFALPKTSEWNITIYNIIGQAVKTFDGYDPAGKVSVNWDATDYASGIYFYRLQAGEFENTKKMVLLK